MVEVRFFDYFRNLGNNQTRTLEEEQNIMEDFCAELLEDGIPHRLNGLTIFSYRIEFEHPEDAVAFKLKHKI